MIDVIGMVTSALMERPIKAILHQMWPEVDAIQRGIDSLSDRVEREALSPILRSVSYLELGELDKARDGLIEAESRHDHAPAVKLALAMTLLRSGESGSPVDRRISDALTMNPFLMPVVTPPVRDLIPTLAAPTPWAQAMTQLNVLPTGRVTRSRRRSVSVSSDAAVLRQVALTRDPHGGGGMVVAVCESLTPGLTGLTRLKRWIIALDLDTGAPRWGVLGQHADGELIVASTRYVVMQTPEPDNQRLVIADAGSGGTISPTMSPTAFSLLFWPAWRSRSTDDRHARSHVEFFPMDRNRLSQMQRELSENLVGLGREVVGTWRDRLSGKPVQSDWMDTTQLKHVSDPFGQGDQPLLMVTTSLGLHRYPLGPSTPVCFSEIRRADPSSEDTQNGR